MANASFLNMTRFLDDLLEQEDVFISQMDNFSKLAEEAKRRTQITFRYSFVIKGGSMSDYEIEIRSEYRLTLEQVLMKLFFSETKFRETKNEIINNIKMIVEFGCQDDKEIDHKIIFDKGKVHNFHYRYRWGVQTLDSETPVPLDTFVISDRTKIHVERFIPDSSFTSLDSKLPKVFLSKNNVLDKTRINEVLFVHLILNEHGKHLYEVYSDRQLRSGEVIQCFCKARGFDYSVLVSKIITYGYDENGLLLSIKAKALERVRFYIGTKETEQDAYKVKPSPSKSTIPYQYFNPNPDEIKKKKTEEIVDRLTKKAVEKIEQYHLALQPRQLGFEFEIDNKYIIIFSLNDHYYAVKNTFASKISKQQLLKLFFKTAKNKEEVNIMAIIGEFDKDSDSIVSSNEFENFVWFTPTIYNLDSEELIELNSYMSKQILELSDFY